MANILLVDDDQENLWSLQVALEGDGHRVSVAGDACRALDILHREPVQFMITDYEMPGIDGAELCRRVRAQPAHSALPILMLSAGPEPGHTRQNWNRFLRKPASFNDLTATIDAHVVVRLTATPKPHPRSVRALTMYQCPPASRWQPVSDHCWP
jgi:CheY-like chemotaxis protein